MDIKCYFIIVLNNFVSLIYNHNMGKYELLASAALVLNMSSFFTLLHNVHITKNTSTLPWKWLLLNASAQILLFTYGILNGSWGIYVPTIFLFCGLSYIAYTKLVYQDKQEDKETKERRTFLFKKVA
jgi:hypothetical protein